MECGIFHTRVPTMVHDQAFLLWPDYPATTYKRASPYPPPGDALGSYVKKWCFGILLSFESIILQANEDYTEKWNESACIFLTSVLCFFASKLSHVLSDTMYCNFWYSQFFCCGIFHTRVPTMVHDQAFLLWPDYPPTTYKRASPYPPPGDALGSSVGSNPHSHYNSFFFNEF
jgi:hypothetical protein